jgi:hypothetical protein
MLPVSVPLSESTPSAMCELMMSEYELLMRFASSCTNNDCKRESKSQHVDVSWQERGTRTAVQTVVGGDVRVRGEHSRACVVLMMVVVVVVVVVAVNARGEGRT